MADISWDSIDIPEFTSIAPSSKSRLPPELPDIVGAWYRTASTTLELVFATLDICWAFL